MRSTYRPCLRFALLLDLTGFAVVPARRASSLFLFLRSFHLSYHQAKVTTGPKNVAIPERNCVCQSLKPKTFTTVMPRVTVSYPSNETDMANVPSLFGIKIQSTLVLVEPPTVKVRADSLGLKLTSGALRLTVTVCEPGQ